MTFNKDTEFILNRFSHELRNPLTTLYSTIQFLELKHPEVKDFQYWSTISQDIEYINLLIDDLSNYAKSEHLNLTTFNLHSLLEQISLSFAASIASSKIEYTSKIDTSIHQITGDKTKLQEVFLNLLKNAYEAASPDKAIFFTATQHDDTITISIRDTGCGIPQERLSTIFEAYVTYKKKGNGLGLPICKQIIQAHGGELTVSSSEGVGTVFTVLLKTHNIDY